MSVVNVEGFTLMSLGIAVIILRIYARWSIVGPSNFQLDDYLMPFAGIVFILETVAAHIVGASLDGLTNSYMTTEERRMLSADSEEYTKRVWGSKIQIIGWSFYAMILWLVKFCLAVFYSRLTTGLMNLPGRVRLGYVILGVTYLMVALCLFLGCQPMKGYWQIYPDPGPLCQPTNSPLAVLIVVIPNVLTDLYLLSIPMPLLWKVNISARKRITLMALFGGAAFCIMATIIRGVTILKSGPNGAVEGSKWACRETFVAIVVSNLPIIHPLLRKAAHSTGLSFLFSSSAKASRSHPLTSKNHKSTRDNTRRKGTHPLSLPGDTAWGSDEHILSPGNPPKEITVVKETIVRSDPWTEAERGRAGGAGAPVEWGTRSSDERVARIERSSSDRQRHARHR